MLLLTSMFVISLSLGPFFYFCSVKQLTSPRIDIYKGFESFAWRE